MTLYKLTNAQKLWASVVLVTSAAMAVLLSKPLPEPEWRVMKSESGALAMPAQRNEQETMASSDFNPEKIAPASLVKATADASLPSVSAQLAWQTGNAKAPVPKQVLNERISAYAVVELDPHPAHLPAVGEQMQLPMLNGKQLIANVESINTASNGDYSWSGHLQGYGTDYPVVMTYGEHSTFATITTPEGSYTLESLDGVGWLYKNPAEIELSTPGSKDYLDVDSTR